MFNRTTFIVNPIWGLANWFMDYPVRSLCWKGTLELLFVPFNNEVRRLGLLGLLICFLFYLTVRPHRATATVYCLFYSSVLCTVILSDSALDSVTT